MNEIPPPRNTRSYIFGEKAPTLNWRILIKPVALIVGTLNDVNTTIMKSSMLDSSLSKHPSELSQLMVSIGEENEYGRNVWWDVLESSECSSFLIGEAPIFGYVRVLMADKFRSFGMTAKMQFSGHRLYVCSLPQMLDVVETCKHYEAPRSKDVFSQQLYCSVMVEQKKIENASSEGTISAIQKEDLQCLRF